MKEYIYLSMIMLESPNDLLSTIKKGLEIKAINISLYLSALNELSLIWMGNRMRSSQLKELYEYLVTFPPILECISRECMIPESIAKTLSCLKRRDPSMKN